MRAAAVQMEVTDERDRNLATADALVTDAAGRGAEFVVLPELFNLIGSARTLRSGAEPLDGPSLTWAADVARRRGLWLLAGSITERIDGDDRMHNTSCLFSPAGDRVATYRKIHLFDNKVDGATYHESATVAPGDEIVTAPLGAVTLGLSTCYDVRFPELFRILALRGAHLIALPSAFTAKTGVDHWEPLVRARAIENQVFVVAPGQIGAVTPTLPLHGHSMIVDPWGTLLAVAPDRECVITADLDFEAQADLRLRLPSLANRRPETYRWS